MINLIRTMNREDTENREEAIYFDQKVEEIASGLVLGIHRNSVSKKGGNDISENGKRTLPCSSWCF